MVFRLAGPPTIEPHGENIIQLFVRDEHGIPIHDVRVKLWAGPPPTGIPAYWNDGIPYRTPDAAGMIEYVAVIGPMPETRDYWMQVIANDGAPQSDPVQFHLPQGSMVWITATLAPEGKISRTGVSSASTPAATLHWDERLTAMNVQIAAVESLAQGQLYWKIVSARYQDERECSGNHNVYCTVLDQNGNPVQGVPVQMDWQAREPDDIPFPVYTDSNGVSNSPMYSGQQGWSPLDGPGPFTVWVGDPDLRGRSPTKIPSERLAGIGLPMNHLANFVVVWKQVIAGGASSAVTTPAAGNRSGSASDVPPPPAPVPVPSNEPAETPAVSEPRGEAEQAAAVEPILAAESVSDALSSDTEVTPLAAPTIDALAGPLNEPAEAAELAAMPAAGSAQVPTGTETEMVATSPTTDTIAEARPAPAPATEPEPAPETDSTPGCPSPLEPVCGDLSLDRADTAADQQPATLPVVAGPAQVPVAHEPAVDTPAAFATAPETAAGEIVTASALPHVAVPVQDVPIAASIESMPVAEQETAPAAESPVPTDVTDSPSADLVSPVDAEVGTATEPAAAPAQEPAVASTQEPATPAQEPAAIPAAEPAAPAEEAQVASTAEPAAPAEEPAVASTLEPATPAQEPAAIPAAEPAAPAEEAAVASTAKPAAPAEEAAVASTAEPAAPAEEAAVASTAEPAAPVEESANTSNAESAAPVKEPAAIPTTELKSAPAQEPNAAELAVPAPVDQATISEATPTTIQGPQGLQGTPVSPSVEPAPLVEHGDSSAKETAAIGPELEPADNSPVALAPAKGKKKAAASKTKPGKGDKRKAKRSTDQAPATEPAGPLLGEIKSETGAVDASATPDKTVEQQAPASSADLATAPDEIKSDSTPGVVTPQDELAVTPGVVTPQENESAGTPGVVKAVEDKPVDMTGVAPNLEDKRAGTPSGVKPQAGAQSASKDLASEPLAQPHVDTTATSSKKEVKTGKPSSLKSLITGKRKPAEPVMQQPQDTAPKGTEPKRTVSSGTRYTVQKGDTLYSIARRYGVTVAAITAANTITNPRLIKTGQVIIIPTISVILPEPTTPIEPTPPAVPTEPTTPVEPTPVEPTPTEPVGETPSVPNWYPSLPPATRPEGALALAKFPRPANDNGRGMHFGLDVRDSDLSNWIPKALELGIKWILFYVQDELQGERAAVAAWEAGIMPVIRVGKFIDNPGVDYAQYAKKIIAHGIPAYIQIFNEPGDPREWRGKKTPSNATERFSRAWADAAARVFDVGGYPGLQILGEEDLTAVVDVLKANGRTDIWNRAFFAIHNYGLNHPPAYPYDELNQKDHPYATILDDDSCVLNLIEDAIWMYQKIGYVLPIIGGEGGWIFGSAEDNRYPKTLQPYHADWHVEMYDWFRTGLLSNGQAIPDYLFSIAPWIFSGIVEAEAWYGGPLGDKKETIAAVKAMPAFVRKFSWDAASQNKTARKR